MKFSIGDLVLLKHTGEEGRVVSYLSNDMVEVEVGGTHFPVFLDEIDHPYLKWFTDKSRRKAEPVIQKLIPEPEQKPMRNAVKRGFHLSFLPVFRFDQFEDIVDKLKIHFINETPYLIKLNYDCSHQGETYFRHMTELRPFSHFYLHDLAFDLMHLQPRFSWTIAQSSDKSKVEEFNDTLRIKPKKLFDYINDSQRNNKPMFNVTLADDFPSVDSHSFDADNGSPDVKKKIESIVTELQRRQEVTKEVIDLHIENLVDDVRGLSNFDMLNIQLSALDDAIDRAIASGQHSLIVIHGVGKGRLKDEIHSLLRQLPGVVSFRHEWHPRYGMGATEIFFEL